MRLGPLICLLAAAVSARGEEPAPFGKTLTIHPARPPAPALSVRLLPARSEQIPGDAAVFYHRAIESLLQVRHGEEIQAIKAGKDDEPELADASTYEWLQLPADKLPREAIRKLLENRRIALEEARLGSLRETCDWGFRHRDEGFHLTLPEIQEMRGLVRWIALKARLDADEGRIDEALAGVKVGMTAARDIGRGALLIQGLVGISLAGVTLDAIEDLIQKPNCPNLYWALAAVPRPLIDMSGAIEAESTMLAQVFPALKTIDGDAWSLEAARSFGDAISQKLGTLINDWPKARSPMSRSAVDDLPAHAAQMMTIARDYRRAGRSLRDAGFTAERIDAMPMIQVVALDSYRAYQRRDDETAKWSYLPYSLGAESSALAERSYPGEAAAIPFAQFVGNTLGANAARMGLERRIALLMVVEALRLYAAEHDGALPARLDDLKETPAPPDPRTGRPFDYKLEGDRAVIQSPPPVGWENVEKAALRYEIRPAR